MTNAALASRPNDHRAGFIGGDVVLNDPPPHAVPPPRCAFPGPTELGETLEGSEAAYWYLHGFRTGRADERHEAPPFWQLRSRRAWNRGRRDGITYS